MEIILVIFAIIGLAIYLISRTNAGHSKLGTGGRSEVAKRQEPDLNALPSQFIVFDLETTGLDCLKHEIIEIGAIRFQKGREDHETFQTLVKHKGRLTPRITEITGINRALIDSEGIPLENAMAEFRDFIRDLPLIAYNADFDMGFLRSANADLGLPTIQNKYACALAHARRAWPGKKSFKLASLAAAGGIESGAAHRALNDAHAALVVFVNAVSVLGTCRLK